MSKYANRRIITGGILLVSLLLCLMIPLFISQAHAESIKSPEKEDVFAFSHDATDQSDTLLQLAGLTASKEKKTESNTIRVIPGGQSIGIKLNTVGVLVVGHHLIETGDGQQSPGEKADIRIGDIITKVNGKKVERTQDISPLVQEAGEANESLAITIKRNKEEIETKLHPLKGKDEPSYKLGLYIRDSATGIGTLTFYEPNSMKYGALGHVIADADTRKPIVAQDGEIVNSTVTSIENGRNGNPGEKLAQFSADRKGLGNITKNSAFGIFGQLSSPLPKDMDKKSYPVALSHEVKEGPAKILTVVNENKVESYDVEVVSTIPQKHPATKGMVIKITDKKLLEKTGGIVQGMSGSPIIQNGKVIGAVTHVFVNDPTSGYGVHIEWMLNEAGISLDGAAEQKAS